jgi:sec-independent protein translocase protein TatA
MLAATGRTDMGTFGPLHWLLLIAVILILFGGRGKISDLMGDFAKGIKSFKKGMSDEDTAQRELPRDEKKDPAIHT